MKVEGLKVFADKGWRSDSIFTSDDGKTVTVAANHKFICQDENNDIVNVTLVSPSPLSFKIGSELKSVTIVGNVSKTTFGWNLKAEIR